MSRAAAAFDWIFRLAMLVCAGLVTLSIIGAIAAIPSGGMGAPIGLQVPQQSPAPAVEEPAPPPAATPPAGADTTGLASRPSEATILQPVVPDEEDEIAGWLESIAYALIALCGLFAIGLLFLWRIARSLDRYRP